MKIDKVDRKLYSSLKQFIWETCYKQGVYVKYDSILYQFIMTVPLGIFLYDNLFYCILSISFLIGWNGMFIVGAVRSFNTSLILKGESICIEYKGKLKRKIDIGNVVGIYRQENNHYLYRVIYKGGILGRDSFCFYAKDFPEEFKEYLSEEVFRIPKLN